MAIYLLSLNAWCQIVLKVIHIISALYQGGAESQLEKLIYHSQSSDIVHIVISLRNDETPLMKRLQAKGISVYCMGLEGILGVVGFLKLIKLLKKLDSPDCIIQCWMYHGNFFGLIAGIVLGISNKVIWNIRRTEVPNGMTGVLSRLSSILSHIAPITIVCCAEAAKESHIKNGYNERSMVVIHNGIDTQLFQPNIKLRKRFRQEIGVKKDGFVIGMIGRCVPIKGHLNLLRSFQLLLSNPKAKELNLNLVLIGRDIHASEPVQAMLNEFESKGRVTVLEERPDIWNAIPGLDLLCLPSISEGFPNVVAESMACGVPSIVTNVGDAALIVDCDSMVVPPKEPKLLADGILRYIEQPIEKKRQFANDARGAIESRFSITQAWANYENLYNNVMKS